MRGTTDAAIKGRVAMINFSAHNERDEGAGQNAVVFSTTLLAMPTLGYLLKTGKNLQRRSKYCSSVTFS